MAKDRKESMYESLKYNQEQIKHKENQRALYIIIYLVFYLATLFVPAGKFSVLMLIVLLLVTVLFFSMSVSREVDIAVYKERSDETIFELGMQDYWGTKKRPKIMQVSRNFVIGAFYWFCFLAYFYFFMK